MSEDWNFRRWLRESRAYTRPMAWWRFYPAATVKWFGFNRMQKADRQRVSA